MNAQKRLAMFQVWAQLNPHPTTELHWSTPFELLTAVLLSAQATDVSVNKVTAQLFKRANTPAAVLALGLETLSELLKSIGLFRNKAKHLLATCEILLRAHDGIVPNSRAALEALPGVGRKTANVILNTAFGEHTIAVDTHIFRVSNRMRMAPGKTVDAVEAKLMKVVPKAFLKNAHHWLILHGRYTCKAINPKCAQCPVFELCEWPERKLRLGREA
jgi:endonuclease-3